MHRETQSQSWGIVMTVDEPAALVLAHLAWHRAQGMAEAHVFLDRPDDPLGARLEGIDWVHVTRCDADHWAEHGERGKRAPSQMRRQAINANLALARAGTDWLLHIDADEFLSQARPLGEELAALRPLGAELNLPMLERAYRAGGPRGLFDGLFRASTRGRTDFDAGLFGPLLPYLNKGLPGHSMGKAGVPVGEGFTLGIHWAFQGGKGPEHRARQFRATSTSLVHFDGLTPLHFIVKLLRYGAHTEALLQKIVSEHRRAQVRDLMAAGPSMDGFIRFHDRLKALPAAEEARLAALGLIETLTLDPASATREMFGDVDLSAEAFDAEVMARYPDIVAMIDGLGA